MIPRASNTIVAVINFASLLVSLAVVGTSARWFSHGAPANVCQSSLRLPLLAAGGALFFLSVLGLVGACCRGATALLWIYLVAVFLLILSIFALSVAAFILTRGVEGNSQRDFSHSMHEAVYKWKNWAVIESCLKEAKVCGGGKVTGVQTDEYFRKYLPTVQSGCCKPPKYCEFKQVNETYWRPTPAQGQTVSSPDCEAWRNEGGEECFGCNSCKRGVLGALMEWWGNISVIGIAVLAFLIVLHSFGGCAMTNHREHRRHHGRSQP